MYKCGVGSIFICDLYKYIEFLLSQVCHKIRYIISVYADCMKLQSNCSPVWGGVFFVFECFVFVNNILRIYCLLKSLCFDHHLV